MDIICAYWPTFISTVLLPLITGIIISIAGWHNLQSRAESDVQSSKMAESIEEIKVNTSDLKDKEELLKHYQDLLSKHNQRDEVLQKVLTQYSSMESALDNFERFTSSPLSQRESLSKEVLSLITTELTPIEKRSDLPNEPLIIETAKNTFRVLFSNPMRISPRLSFLGLPDGVDSNVIENSPFGFTVVFSPLSIHVSDFGYTADARL